MKKAFLLLSAIIACPHAAPAADIATPHVTVNGTATTEVAPDQMNWRIKIRNEGAELEAVTAQHTNRVKAVLDYLKQQELPAHCIQTAGMQFGEKWATNGRTRVRDGFVASSDISFKVLDLGKYRTLWGGISRLEHVSLTGVQYDHSQRVELRHETRIKALLAARKKAEALAEALGARLGKPLFIEESAYGYGPTPANTNFYLEQAGQQANGGGALAPGQIPITMQIRASFQLVTDTP